MDFFVTVAALFMANVLTLCFGWAIVQFHRYDYRAPWAAYVAFAFPLLILLAAVTITEGLPPPLDALALR